MTPAELKTIAYNALDEMKGVEITAIDVADRTTVTDWMIVVGGTSQRHVKSLAGSVVEKCKENGVRPLGTEGDDGDWILVDLGDVIVHVMTAESRDFYALEKLWTMEPAERDNLDQFGRDALNEDVERPESAASSDDIASS